MVVKGLSITPRFVAHLITQYFSQCGEKRQVPARGIEIVFGLANINVN